MVTQILGIDDIKEAKRYELSEADWEAIDELADKSIKIGIGIMASHPNMNIIEVKDYHQVTVDITISVEQNRIADCRILVISLDKVI